MDRLVFRFWIYPSVPETFAIESKAVRNRAEFCMFLAPSCSGEKPPKFCDLDYETEHTSDHVAKFHGDRSREFRDLAMKRKETAVKRY